MSLWVNFCLLMKQMKKCELYRSDEFCRTSFQTSHVFLRLCQTFDCVVTEGCVLEAIDVGADVLEFEVLTTTTGFTSVVVLMYWAFTSGTCPTLFNIGVVNILPAKLVGARIWAVTWLPWETTVIGVNPARGACWPTIWAIWLSVDGAVCITVVPVFPVDAWIETPPWLNVNPENHRK